MPFGQRLLNPILTRTLRHPVMQELFHHRHEWWRQLRGKPQQVEVWLRFTDPYSYLLIQTLPNFISHFDVKLIFKLLPYQEPNQFFSYYLRDAWHLAQFHQLQFHHFHAPSEEQCLIASQLLLANRHLPTDEFLILAKQVFLCLWEHQHQKLAMLSLRFQNLSVSTTHKKLQQAQLLFDSLNFNKSAMLQFHRSFYWGIDELPLLAKRLELVNLDQAGHPFSLHQDQHQSNQDYLINDWQQLAQIRSQKYELDFYFNFQDPLSYIYLIATQHLSQHYQIKLNLRPIYLDDDSRQHDLHFSFYELIHLQELAQSYNLQINSNYILSAQGLRHCFALFYAALLQDQASAMTEKILAAIWTDNKDLSYLPHLQSLLADLGYNNKQFKELLKQQAWHGMIEHNTNQWLQLDLPELPSFYLQGEKRISVCGAHRLWTLEMTLIEQLNEQNTLK